VGPREKETLITFGAFKSVLRILKIVTVISILLAFCIFASCDDDPVELKKKTPPNYSGTFLMADTLIISTCTNPDPPDSVEHVAVRNDTIIFAGFYGTWDASTLRGEGSQGPIYVPIDQTCTAQLFVIFNITFLDEDRFYGTWEVQYNYHRPCIPSYTCAYTYKIGGTRL
jgi:hypothetical protein